METTTEETIEVTTCPTCGGMAQAIEPATVDGEPMKYRTVCTSYHPRAGDIDRSLQQDGVSDWLRESLREARERFTELPGWAQESLRPIMALATPDPEADDD